MNVFSLTKQLNIDYNYVHLLDHGICSHITMDLKILSKQKYTGIWVSNITRDKIFDIKYGTQSKFRLC